jgi:signal transduction histidine kinase
MVPVLTRFQQPRSGVIAITLACVLLIDALIAWMVLQGRRDVLADGRRNAQRLVHLLEEQTRKAFQTADLSLVNLKNTLEQPVRPAENDAALRVRLRESTADLPHVRAFFAVGADGFIIHDSDYPSTPRTNLADRDYFTVHQRDADVGIYVGKPLKSRSIDQWFVPVSRRVEKDGAFRGIVVAAVEPRFFEEFYRALRLGPRDSIALFSTDDTTLIARFPNVPGLVGERWPQLNLFQQRRHSAPSGTFVSESFQHGRAIISYRGLEPLPLVTTVVLNEWDLLAGWRRSALAWGVTAALAFVLILIFGGIVTRHRREHQAAVEHALKAQKLEALGHMTGGIAHDFNNVLTVVGASLRLMRRSGAEEQYVAAGEQALERGARLTSQLLNFAKRHQLSRSLEDANELLRSLEPMLKQAAGPGVRVTCTLDGGILPCVVDRGQFDAAIINLVVNAAQAMPQGEIVVSTHPVMIGRQGQSVLKAGRYVAVRVKDHGCGIAPADLKHVFEPFYTTKKDAGTGLGLAQVYALLHRLGGDARIESRLGVGTTVELLFPCWEQSATSIAEQRDATGAEQR